jgi:hypothetical protein
MVSSIVFPETLSCNNLKVSSNISDNFLTKRYIFEPEVGSPRVRRYFSSSPRVFDLNFHFDKFQFSIFYNFYYNVIKQGFLEFDIKLVDGNENLPAWFTVRLLDQFKTDVTSQNEYKVSLKVYTLKDSFAVRPPEDFNLNLFSSCKSSNSLVFSISSILTFRSSSKSLSYLSFETNNLSLALKSQSLGFVSLVILLDLYSEVQSFNSQIKLLDNLNLKSSAISNNGLEF